MRKRLGVSIILTVMLFSVLKCKSGNSGILHGDLHDYYSTEEYRKVAIDEKMRESGEPQYFKDLFTMTKYEVPDSIPESDPRIKYFKKHKNLPPFIKQAICNNEVIEMMTIGEFFLSRPDLIGHSIILADVSNPQILQIGLFRYYNKDHNNIQGGPCWAFRNGFFWYGGVV